jgi:hypothetical protein
MLWSHTLIGWGPETLCLCPKHASFFTISQGCLESGMNKSAGHLCLRPFPPWALEVEGLMCRLVGLFGEAHHRCILQPAAKFQVSFTGIDSAKRWASHQSRVLFSTPKIHESPLLRVESWQIEHDNRTKLAALWISAGMQGNGLLSEDFRMPPLMTFHQATWCRSKWIWLREFKRWDINTL